MGTGYTLTASADGLTSATSNAFDIVPGAPAHVAFVNQPTDTLVNQTISPPGVTVHVTDAGNNDVPGTPVTLSIDPSSPAAGAGITGNSANTNSSGVARFDNLSINTTSSGYVLDADASGVKSNPNSDSFNITNTDSGCTDCTATFPGGGTVTAPAGTTLIIENNDTSGCATSIVSPIAGTVTVIPIRTPADNLLITFVDLHSKVDPPQVDVTYPVCKTHHRRPRDPHARLRHPFRSMRRYRPNGALHREPVLRGRVTQPRSPRCSSPRPTRACVTDEPDSTNERAALGRPFLVQRRFRQRDLGNGDDAEPLEEQIPLGTKLHGGTAVTRPGPEERLEREGHLVFSSGFARGL